MADREILKKYVIKGLEVVYKEIESKSVLLNLENGKYYTLNKTGTFIWSLIDGKTKVNHIIEQLTLLYDVTRGEATKDVFALISTLENEGLIQLHDQPA